MIPVSTIECLHAISYLPHTESPSVQIGPSVSYTEFSVTDVLVTYVHSGTTTNLVSSTPSSDYFWVVDYQSGSSSVLPLDVLIVEFKRSSESRVTVQMVPTGRGDQSRGPRNRLTPRGDE